MKPTPKKIKAARLKAQLTQQQAADVMGVLLRSWQRWEYGTRAMNPRNWELFLIKVKHGN